MGRLNQAFSIATAWWFALSHSIRYPYLYSFSIAIFMLPVFAYVNLNAFLHTGSFLAIVLFLLLGLFCCGIYGGVVRASLNICDGGNARVRTLFCQLRYLPKIIALELIQLFIATLFIVPFEIIRMCVPATFGEFNVWLLIGGLNTLICITIFAIYGFSIFFLIDRSLSVIASLHASYKLARRFKTNAILLALSNIIFLSSLIMRLLPTSRLPLAILIAGAMLPATVMYAYAYRELSA